MDENDRRAKGFTFREWARLLLAITFGLVVGVSCMSVGIGNKIVDPNHAEVTSVGTLKQEASFSLLTSIDEATSVFYPRPYQSPPNLQIVTDVEILPASDFIEIVEQKSDHFKFRVKRSPTPLVKFTWKAEGLLNSTAPTTMTTGVEPTIVVPATAKEGRP